MAPAASPAGAGIHAGASAHAGAAAWRCELGRSTLGPLALTQANTC